MLESRTPPKHVAMDLEGVAKWAEQHQVPLQEAYQLSFHHIYAFIEHQAMLNVPVITFFVTSPSMRGTLQGDAVLAELVDFLNNNTTRELFSHHKMKVTVLGKWYDLPQPVVEAVRRVSEETRAYHSFFVNFCLNYDGQEEIVDACKVIARLVKLSKIDPDMITKDVMKENLATSYFIPPDIIIRNGARQMTTSLLLWDSPGAYIIFSGKLFPELSVADFLGMIQRR